MQGLDEEKKICIDCNFGFYFYPPSELLNPRDLVRGPCRAELLLPKFQLFYSKC